ncbi:MAG: heme exporter protein D [Pseudorhodobacter sp.]|jgi:heme exporter protein D
MMPDLGKYAGTVLTSYAASIALIVALVMLSLWQSAKIRKALREVETRQGKDNG